MTPAPSRVRGVVLVYYYTVRRTCVSNCSQKRTRDELREQKDRRSGFVRHLFLRPFSSPRYVVGLRSACPRLRRRRTAAHRAGTYCAHAIASYIYLAELNWLPCSTGAWPLLTIATGADVLFHDRPPQDRTQSRAPLSPRIERRCRVARRCNGPRVANNVPTRALTGGDFNSNDMVALVAAGIGTRPPSPDGAGNMAAGSRAASASYRAAPVHARSMAPMA